MKFIVVVVLAYAIVAQAALLPIVPHVGKVGHAVAAGAAGSVGLAVAAGVHAAVHGAEKIGSAVVGTGLGALELGTGVVTGIKDGLSGGLHSGLGLGSGEHVDRPESAWKEGSHDNGIEYYKREHGGDLIDTLRDDLNPHKRDIHDYGFRRDEHHRHREQV